jgi:hypothetical protein
VWNSSTTVNDNLSNGYWYQEVPCPVSSSSSASTQGLACNWSSLNGKTTWYISGGNIEGGVNGRLPAPVFTCNGNTPSGGAQPSQKPWENFVASSNLQTVSLTTGLCGSSETVTCSPSVYVYEAPRINTCPGFGDLSGAPGSSLSGSKPTVTLADNSNLCSANGSSTPNGNWTETWSYTSPSNGTFNWNSLPTTTGTYRNFSVQGTCGGYQVPSITCNGTINVSASSTTTVTCNIQQSNYVIPDGSTCVSVPKPNVSCGNGVTVGTAIFRVDSGTGGEVWASSNSNTQQFCNTANNRPVYLSSVICGSGSTNALNQPISCGNLTITKAGSSGGTACAFQQSWCPGVNWANGIKWGQNFEDTQGTCWFFQGASNSTPSCNCGGSCCSVNQGDGGYYIYVSGTSYGLSNGGTSLQKPTNCVGP